MSHSDGKYSFNKHRRIEEKHKVPVDRVLVSQLIQVLNFKSLLIDCACDSGVKSDISANPDVLFTQSHCKPYRRKHTKAINFISLRHLKFLGYYIL